MSDTESPKAAGPKTADSSTTGLSGDGASKEVLERALADLHTLQGTLARLLEQQGRIHLGLRPDQIFPKRNFFGKIRGRAWVPTSPGVFTRNALEKLSTGGRRTRSIFSKVAVWLSQTILIVAMVVSSLTAVVSVTFKVAGITLFPGLNEGEKALVTICTALFGATLAALLYENRLFRVLRDESTSILQLNEMDERYAQMARDGIAYYSAIVKNIRHKPRLEGRRSPVGYYRLIAATELGAHRESLRRLAQGTYSAPEFRVDDMLDAVLDSVKTYAAVSHRDTPYWRGTDEQTRQYRRHLDTASRAGKVMRIFVVSLTDLRDKWDEVLGVLEDQDGINVRWGLCVEERLNRSITSLWNAEVVPHLAQVRPGTLDFALVNGGEVTTFFTRDIQRGERHLLAAFNVPAREKTIVACAGLYTRLLSEVWIGSESFAKEWKRFLPSIKDEQLRGDAGTPEKFVRKMDRQWKATRLRALLDDRRRELVTRMGIDAQMVMDCSGPRTPLFEVVCPRSKVAEGMETFRQILKADVFATMKREEVDALCTPEETQLYRRVARELGIKRGWIDDEPAPVDPS